MIKESKIFVIIVHVCNEQLNDHLNHAEKYLSLILPEEQIFSFVVTFVVDVGVVVFFVVDWVVVVVVVVGVVTDKVKTKWE